MAKRTAKPDYLNPNRTPDERVRDLLPRMTLEEKVDLKPGEKTTVSFTLGPDDLALYDRNMERVVEPGDFTVEVGGKRKTFTVVAE